MLLPKLFRRLVDYLSINSGDVSLAGLPAYLATRDDRVIVASTGQVTGFDTFSRSTGRPSGRPGRRRTSSSSRREACAGRRSTGVR